MTRLLSGAGVAVAMIAMTAPLSVKAATVNADIGANETFTQGFDMESGDTQEFNFSVTEDLVISQFAISGSAPSSADDLANIRFGLTSPPQDRFDNIESVDDVFAATNFVEGAMFEVGETFSFYFTDGNEGDVSLTLSFDTETPAPIPVPAAGMLLLSALAGGAVFSRRKRSLA